MSRCDIELKKLKKEAGVYWSDVSDELGIAEATLYRILRHDMNPDTRDKIAKAIKTVGQKGAIV